MRIVFVLVLCLTTSSAAFADIYKYTAPDGSVYYTDQPEHRYYKRIIRTKPQSYTKALSHVKQNKSRYNEIIAQAAFKHQVDEKLLHAVIQTESAYQSDAVSSAGAVGLMQLMPGTAKRYGVTNRSDPVENINGGTRYLKDLLKMFNSNLKLAVAAYNAGENAVKKYNNSIPPYPETRNYVQQVLALYRN
ncbi:MAG: lytic transglycosylase [Gammaproteobacteria bacterium HGW-Gammaproteobacteria-3]|nr:MAG: lytic transglycosylase [Gammaproteobacteria bacterium HGW-Gammaproteobacteria-3]